jgi:hypothetical protein
VIVVAFLIIAVIVFYALYAKHGKIRTATPIEADWIPLELQGAKCVMNEQNIYARNPAALHGRVDQVFEMKNGSWVVVDTKRRNYNKVFQSDIVQLTVYAVILANKGHPVVPYGYVRLVNQSGVATYRKVTLFTADTVIALRERYLALKHNKTAPRCSCGKHSSL